MERTEIQNSECSNVGYFGILEYHGKMESENKACGRVVVVD